MMTPLLAQNASYQVTRIEPPFWWVGMETPLQLMLCGPDLASARISCLTPGVTITGTHPGDSPNYLFVDVAISAAAKPGDVTFALEGSRLRTTFTYALQKRVAHSAQREGLTGADVLYLLMPDRFVNGSPENDNSPLAAEQANPSATYGRHGGDVQGMLQALPYLDKLGITAIWPTPVTFDNEPGASYHGYACADYYRIDPRFGSNQEYADMVAAAAKKGIKFLQDIVPNHCGTAHWWMQDLPFKDWINVFDTYTHSNVAMSTHMDPHATQTDYELCVRGWFDHSMADMNLTNPYVLQYFIQATVWWIEYAGLAGVRVDTYPYSDYKAITAYTDGIHREYPKATVLAECWFNTPQQIAYFEGGPQVMDFVLQGELAPALMQEGPAPWGGGMTRIYNVLSNDFVYKNPNNLLIFGDNHDTHRLFELLGRNPEKLKMAYTLLATLRGVPQLYYGSELMRCAEDPARLGHGEERVDMPAGYDNAEMRTPVENDMFNYISKLLNWRQGNKAVQEGTLLHYLPTLEVNAYVYFRITDSKRVMVVVNNGLEPFSIDWAHYAQGLGDVKKGVEVISDQKVTVGEETVVPAQTAWVIDF